VSKKQAEEARNAGRAQTKKDASMRATSSLGAKLSLITIGLLACTGLALADSDNHTENFEGITAGTAIGTQPGWTATETNSVVATIDYAADYQGSAYPIPGTHTKVLAVVNGVTNTIAAGSESVTNWIDVVVKPVVSDDAPSIPAVGTVGAVYVNTNMNPVVMHTPSNDVAYAEWVEIPDVTIGSNDWIRLTIATSFGTPLNVFGGNSTRFYQVMINGTVVTNAAAFQTADRTSGPNGSWFGNMAGSSRKTPVTNVIVQGNAYIDDLVMNTTSVLVPPPPAAASFVYVLPTVSELTEGDTLADAVLTDGTATNAAGDLIDGSYGFVAESTEPPVGTNPYEVRFTPDNLIAYLMTTGSVDVVVVAGATETPNGTPYAWYDQFLSDEASSNSYEDLDLMDSDDDGVLNGDEFQAGTRPNDIESVLKLIGVNVTTTNVTLQWIGGTNGPVAAGPYKVESADTLGGTIEWSDMTNTLPRAEGTNVWTQDGVQAIRYFRIRAAE
jgi:hypothetical protein